MPGYVIVGVEWHSEEAFDAYAEGVHRTIEMFGGRYIVGTRDVDVRKEAGARRSSPFSSSTRSMPRESGTSRMNIESCSIYG